MTLVKKKYSRAIMAQLLVPLNIIFIVLFTVAGFLAAPLYKRSVQQSMVEKTESTLGFLSIAARAPIDNYDSITLNSYVKATLADKDYHSLYFVDNNSKNITEDTGAAIGDLDKTVSLEKPILNSESKPLGKVIVRFSTKKITDAFNHAIGIIVGTAIFVQIILCSVIFIIIRRPVGLLNRVSVELHNSGQEVFSASQQLTSVSQAISSGTVFAASSLQQIVASLEELSSTVSQNADYAREAATHSQQGSQVAERGSTETAQLIIAMNDISKSSKKIEEIISIIDDIAFQTNLLSLNAAVEAARAGEQGKGFAVVADAVRGLAHRSADAAKDISLLIRASIEKVENGCKIADASGQALSEIVGAVGKIAALNKEIASASQQQASGISQISKAMNQLDQSTQQNAASSEEAAASAKMLEGQALLVQQIAADLVIIIQGSKAAANVGSKTTVAEIDQDDTRPRNIRKTFKAS